MSAGSAAAQGRPAGRIKRTAEALRRHPFRVASAVCLLAAGSYAAAEPGWTSHQLALSFGPRPAHYSELFFTDISSLPINVPPASDAKVPFAIVNREGKTISYGYSVTLSSPGVRVLAEKQHVMVENNHKASLIARFKSGKPHTAFTITIKINQPYDYIEFHGKTS